MPSGTFPLLSSNRSLQLFVSPVSSFFHLLKISNQNFIPKSNPTFGFVAPSISSYFGMTGARRLLLSRKFPHQVKGLCFHKIEVLWADSSVFLFLSLFAPLLNVFDFESYQRTNAWLHSKTLAPTSASRAKEKGVYNLLGMGRTRCDERNNAKRPHNRLLFLVQRVV